MSDLIMDNELLSLSIDVQNDDRTSLDARAVIQKLRDHIKEQEVERDRYKAVVEALKAENRALHEAMKLPARFAIPIFVTNNQAREMLKELQKHCQTEITRIKSMNHDKADTHIEGLEKRETYF